MLWSLVLLASLPFYVGTTPLKLECPKGTYMYENPSWSDDHYDCVPCPDGTFMPVSHSKHRQCYDCTQIEDPTLEVLIRPCEKTRDADIQCVEGYYRVLPRNPRQKAVCAECTPCHELFHEIRACQNYSNTYCCADVNYDFVLDGSGIAWCRERHWMCRRGQYLDTSLNKCNPCPDNTFMPQDYHSYTSCRPCHSTLDAGVPLHTEIIQECNSTHPALYRCKEGYYVNHTLSYRGTDIGCSPCQTCQQGMFVGRPCSSFQNTVCCPQENMTVVDGAEGAVCQDVTAETGELLNLTTPSQVNDSSNLQTNSETPVWLYVFASIGVAATVGLVVCIIFSVRKRWIQKKDNNYNDPDVSLEAAERKPLLTEDNSNHEPKMSYTGEASLILCQKNPGHVNFIPANTFNIHHLPYRYRNNLLVDYVRAMSDITCRPSVSRISKDRPETWPDSDLPYPFSSYKGKAENSMMSGTGWVCQVFKYTELYNINCKCNKCKRSSNTPKKTWGVITIKTACHVVHDNEEARHTKCQFFNDSDETEIKTVPTLTLTGGEVVGRDIKGDWCTINYVTHDVELLDRFNSMYKHWMNLREKVIKEYLSNYSPDLSVPGVGCDTNTRHNLCIIVSHPHGCSKSVSVGTWTHRLVVNDNGLRESFKTYSYNTPTCPGSAGAPVLTLDEEERESGAFYDPPIHSQGCPGNKNNSGNWQKWNVKFHTQTLLVSGA